MHNMIIPKFDLWLPNPSTLAIAAILSFIILTPNNGFEGMDLHVGGSYTM